MFGLRAEDFGDEKQISGFMRLVSWYLPRGRGIMLATESMPNDQVHALE